MIKLNSGDYEVLDEELVDAAEHAFFAAHPDLEDSQVCLH